LVLENIGLPMNLNLALSDTATIGSADGEIDVSLNQAKHGPTFGYLKNIREQLIAGVRDLPARAKVPTPVRQ
jgi:hypothetical protein